MTTGSINSAASGALTGSGSTSVPTKKDSVNLSFEQQLSQAVTESLRKLGNAPGEFQISVRNGDSAATRQITITYTDKATPTLFNAGSAPSGSTAITAPATSAAPVTVGNPFAGTSPALDPATKARNEEPTSTSWAPYVGPRDTRDALPQGGGLLTNTGAPDIRVNNTPARNQYNYAGPAALNPYFTNPGNPLREGYVLGFNQWFQNAQILGPSGRNTQANPSYYATEEGANEALRLVQQYQPNASVSSKIWGGGPFASSQPMFSIKLPNGTELNAGNVLAGYYNRGFGVTISSDADLERAVRSV